MLYICSMITSYIDFHYRVDFVRYLTTNACNLIDFEFGDGVVEHKVEVIEHLHDLHRSTFAGKSSERHNVWEIDRSLREQLRIDMFTRLQFLRHASTHYSGIGPGQKRQEAQLPQRDSASATHVFLGSLTDRALHWAPHCFIIDYS